MMKIFSPSFLTRACVPLAAIAWMLAHADSARAIDSEAAHLPDLPQLPSFSNNPHEGDWLPLGHARLNLNGPNAQTGIRRIIQSELNQIFSPAYFTPSLPAGATMLQNIRSSGRGMDVQFTMQAQLRPEGCPLGISPLINARLSGRTDISFLGRGSESMLYGRIPCDGGYRIRLDLSGSDPAVLANASALVVDACMRNNPNDGSLALDLYTSLIVGDDWGTRCAGANIRRLLRMQTTPIANAIQRLYNANLNHH